MNNSLSRDLYIFVLYHQLLFWLGVSAFFLFRRLIYIAWRIICPDLKALYSRDKLCGDDKALQMSNDMYL